jgi:hypothetical protein
MLPVTSDSEGLCSIPRSCRALPADIGLPSQVTLEQIAADRPQTRELGREFDSFGNHIEPESAN